jgi:hypothetical protein
MSVYEFNAVLINLLEHQQEIFEKFVAMAVHKTDFKHFPVWKDCSL